MNLGLRQLTGADIAVCKVEILARSEDRRYYHLVSQVRDIRILSSTCTDTIVIGYTSLMGTKDAVLRKSYKAIETPTIAGQRTKRSLASKRRE